MRIQIAAMVLAFGANVASAAASAHGQRDPYDNTPDSGGPALPRDAGAAAIAQTQSQLNTAPDLFHADNYEKAAPLLYTVSEESGQPELQFRAEGFLAQSLFKMGLLHSALYYDSVIIDEGPNHPYYLEAIENMVEVMDAIGDKSSIPFLLDRYYNDAFSKLTKPVIDRINFIVALWGHEFHRIEESAAFLRSIKSDSAVYPRASYLLGVQFAQGAKDGKDELNDKTIAKFEEVRGLRSTAQTTYADLERLKDLATMGLARVRFRQGNFGDAMELYKQNPKSSRERRNALFEGAYSAFMKREDTEAIRLLNELHSSEFHDQFVPESWLLESMIYYYDCLFDEAADSLSKLRKIYSSETLGQIKAIFGVKQPPSLFYDLLVNGWSGDLKMPAILRNELMADEQIDARRKYVNELIHESTLLNGMVAWKDTPLRKALLDAVGLQRAKLEATTGTAVIRALGFMQLKLEDFDAQAEILKAAMAERQASLAKSHWNPTAAESAAKPKDVSSICPAGPRP